MSKKKPFYKINPSLRKYLRAYNREFKLPVSYEELAYHQSTIDLYDKDGKNTLWESCIYSETERENLYQGLREIYALLKAEGDLSVMTHLDVERIDYCTFGNTNPYRIRIINKLNDNYDHFYVKKADASRVYGLELEHILSPNRINFLVHKNTLIEEHIAGIPGDVFKDKYLNKPDTNKTRIAKEFVKFNERCFVRLLGDMRAYNFIFDITPDFEEVQYRIRAIDFDQQSYEGRMKIYRPQFFKENFAFVELVMKLLPKETIMQYQREERALIAGRIKSSRYQLKDLLDVMVNDTISTDENIKLLREELAEHYKTKVFLKCLRMGEIVKTSLWLLVTKNILNKNIIK
ncbi:MAG: hypothetical protein EA412_01365 [Chitinophagaceae bacterium]|nr:MAG: hypothetical protein EA412_01365 [Chitinophagaceae bacterium]